MELTPETAKQDRAEVARRGIPLTRRGAGEYIFLGAAWRQHDATEPLLLLTPHFNQSALQRSAHGTSQT
ncbi:unnamed protein product [Boreogadus saida]